MLGRGVSFRTGLVLGEPPRGKLGADERTNDGVQVTPPRDVLAKT